MLKLLTTHDLQIDFYQPYMYLINMTIIFCSFTKFLFYPIWDSSITIIVFIEFGFWKKCFFSIFLDTVYLVSSSLINTLFQKQIYCSLVYFLLKGLLSSWHKIWVCMLFYDLDPTFVLNGILVDCQGKKKIRIDMQYIVKWQIFFKAKKNSAGLV